MSQDRPSPPQKPFTVSVQAEFQQGFGFNQFYNYATAVAPKPNDAEAYCKQGGSLREQRRFDEALAAFDRAIALKPNYAEAHNSRGIVLANLARFDDALAAFAKAIILKPNYAETYNNRALVLQALGRLAEALASFDKAIALQPDNARVHNNRGETLRDLNRYDEALACYDEALARKPDYAEAYYNRGIVLQDLTRFDQALAAFDQAIALKPDYAAAYNNRGVVLHGLQRLDEALADYDKALALIPDYAEVRNNKSLCLLQEGRFEQGWRLHEWRKKTERPVGNRSFPQPLWLGTENVAGKTVFVHWEQGLGDTINFCRYAKLLQARGAKVVMSVQEILYRLLRTMSPGMEIIKQDEVPVAFDYHCPLMSLPLAFGATLENIPAEPYIFADELQRKAWHARLPPTTKPRIGVVWSGNAKHRNDHNRSIDFQLFASLLSGDAHWICLQKELRPGESALLQPHQIVFIGDELEDFFDTAAVIDLLDLVVTVDTSVAHLAGAMGKPVWMLLAYAADWRWLSDRDDSPWYPSARLFRQDHSRSWKNVIARVDAALRDFVRLRP